MKSNCNDLELRLVTPSVSYHSLRDQESKQQLSIFYNGRVATCDVTELQARAIILLAKRQMLDQKMALGATGTAGLSMKRSLQRFLQKRKTRAQSASPYTQYYKQ
ncbi:protein TIFY 5A-like [Henckelia pumila]|uniref:protein TIFY 5A-like n=1 Tax=Henckelia pumila TaxID=405737 RepID=UPI003C6DCE61